MLNKMATARRSIRQCHNKLHDKNAKRLSPTANLSMVNNVSCGSSPKLVKRRQTLDDSFENDSDLDETDCCYHSLSELEVTNSSKSALLDDSEQEKDSNSPGFRKRKGDKLYPNLDGLQEEAKNNAAPKTERRRGPGPFIMISFIFVLIFSIYIIGKFVLQTKEFYAKPDLPRKSLEEIHVEIKRNLKMLHHNVPQTQHFWVTISSSIQDVVEDSPPQPSIILALVPKDSQKTAICLLQHVSQIVSDAFGDDKELMYDGMSANLQKENEAAHDLEDFLHELSLQHTAIVHNLEKLPPKCAMILHAFTDNENAPHKRSLIIFTLGVDVHYSNLSKDVDADKILNKLWENKLRDVDAAAIIARIANSPVVIKPEATSYIDKLCPYK